MHEVTAAHLKKEDRFLAAIETSPDFQCAWQLLLKCAVPRASYFLRALPGSAIQEYALGHDKATWSTALRLLGRRILTATFSKRDGAWLPCQRASGA